jgi:hypothetical protein
MTDMPWHCHLQLSNFCEISGSRGSEYEDGCLLLGYCNVLSGKCLANITKVLAACIIRTITLMMETASTFEMSVNFHQTTQCNNPEDSQLHI